MASGPSPGPTRSAARPSGAVRLASAPRRRCGSRPAGFTRSSRAGLSGGSRSTTSGARSTNQSGTKFGASTTVNYESLTDLVTQYGRRWDPVEQSPYVAYQRQNCTSTYGCVTSWRQVYYDVQKLVVDEAMEIILYAQIAAFEGLQPYVKGYVPMGKTFGRGPQLRVVWIE